MLVAILKKEMKMRIRNKKSPLYISIYLVILLITLILSFIMLEDFSYNKYSFNPRVAVEIYNILMYVQFGVIAFIAVNLSVLSIKEESDNRTLDILIGTEAPNQMIIFGKILSLIIYIIVLYFVALPIIVTIFLLGGISIINILLILFFSIIVTLLLSSIGVLYSVIIKDKIKSLILSNITISIFIFGNVITNIFDGIKPLQSIKGLLSNISPLNTLNSILDTTFIIGETNVDISFLPNFIEKYWIYYSIIYLAVSFVIIYISSQLLRKQALN